MRVQDLLDVARTATGLHDFGADTFREGLEVLVLSLDTEADLSVAGRDAVFGQIVGCLTNRLTIEDWYRRHPEIDDQSIVAPLFQLGLPRTGSTALGNLLAQDPAVRYLRTWEAGSPCPPPDPATERNDARIARTQARLDGERALAPSLRSMLPVSPTGPTECGALMGLEFRSVGAVAAKKLPTFSTWLLDCDMEPGYLYHRRVLKLLQWRRPPTRWRLRSPAHMASIDALDRVYPDAQFVMTHRDVASVIPSVASLLAAISSTVTERQDQLYLGEYCASLWETSLKRTIAFRDAGREARFHDLGFLEVQRDPVGSVRKLYASMGEELTPATEQLMATWWADNPRDQHGSHVYQAEDFGLSTDELHARFSFYNDRFEVPQDR
jgi:hypothetical protein